MRKEIVYQKGISDEQFQALRMAYYNSDNDVEYPHRPYEISAGDNYLRIDNLGSYDEDSHVSLYGNDRMIVLFALAEMLGYDLIKKEN